MVTIKEQIQGILWSFRVCNRNIGSKLEQKEVKMKNSKRSVRKYRCGHIKEEKRLVTCQVSGENVRISETQHPGDVARKLTARVLGVNDITKKSAERFIEVPKAKTMKDRFVNADFYIENEPPELEWIVEGLIPKGGRTMLSADKKAGKTIIVLSMAIAMARGEDWLGLPTKQSKVLFCDGEVGGDELHRRIHKLAAGVGDVDNLEGQLIVAPPELRLTNTDGVDEWTKAVESLVIDVLILDPIANFHLGTDASDADVNQVQDAIGKIQLATGATVIFTGHFSRAAAKRPGAGDRYFGSIRYAADAVSMLELDKDADDIRTLHHTECRYSGTRDPIGIIIEFTDDAIRLTKTEVERKELSVGERIREWVLDFLRPALDEEHMAVPRLAIHEAAALEGFKQRNLDEVLKQCVKKGELEHGKVGKEVHYKLVG